jgi:hypothetical protein
MRRVLIAVLLVGLLNGCGFGGDVGWELGVRRVALSLAFADEDKAEPVDPRVIVRLIPAPDAALVPDADLGNIPTVLGPKCPAAPDNARIVDVANVGIERPFAAGRYARHNQGTLKIQGAIEITLPFPRQTTWDVEDLHEVEPPDVLEDPTGPFAAPDEERGPPYSGEDPGAPMWEYSVRKTYTSQFTVVDTYRLTSRRVLLLKRETITSDGSTTFTPDPPITFLEHAQGEGRAWRSAGIDQSTGQAMYIDAIAEKREGVDVCGTVHDAYRVVMQERMVNLATGETSGTSDEAPNVYHVATQLGGQILREEQHFTQTITTPDGAAIIIWDYSSTQDSTEPSVR